MMCGKLSLMLCVEFILKFREIWLLATEMMQTFGGKRQYGNLKFGGKRQTLSYGSEKAKMV